MERFVASAASVCERLQPATTARRPARASEDTHVARAVGACRTGASARRAASWPGSAHATPGSAASGDSAVSRPLGRESHAAPSSPGANGASRPADRGTSVSAGGACAQGSLGPHAAPLPRAVPDSCVATRNEGGGPTGTSTGAGAASRCGGRASPAVTAISPWRATMGSRAIRRAAARRAPRTAARRSRAVPRGSGA